jgi:pimeloyl-ACP methyl ester carboxylesterase
VHGAWGGGWAWRDMDARLSKAGHHVLRATLTGLGERVHLASPEISLSTHVTDVVNLLRYEDVKDVILVGHSYGGMVITGVAEREAARIRHLVYIDAYFPEDGESAVAMLGGGREPSSWVEKEQRDGFLVPSWLDPKCPVPCDVPHPARTFTEPLAMKSEAARKLPGTYILTIDPGLKEDTNYGPYAARAKKRGFRMHTLAADHNPQRSAPQALFELLEAVR